LIVLENFLRTSSSWRARVTSKSIMGKKSKKELEGEKPEPTLDDAHVKVI
jgi:hypothetical protein